MSFLKNYLYILITFFSIVVLTKMVFLIYLYEVFTAYTLWELLYAVLWGYKFDIAISGVFTLVITFFDWNKKSMLYVAVISIIAVYSIQISDIMYFYESTRHIGYEIRDTLIDLDGLAMTAYNQHFMLVLFYLVSLIILVFGYFKILNNKLQVVTVNKKYFGKKLLLLVLSLFFVRGMFMHIPLNPWQASNIGDEKLASLALNGTYNTLYALVNASKELKPHKLLNRSDLDNNSTFKYLYSDNVTYAIKPEKRNIVFLFLESWSAVNMKTYGFTAQTTPNFDAILKKSVRPKAMLAGGHRTTEGIFASLVSCQNPLGNSVAKTPLQDFQYQSIINILSENGYSSAFFQGSSKETSGTGAFVQSLGFKESYGKRDITNTPLGHNSWGVYDQDLYRFVGEKLETMKEPFVIGINGATTHDDQIPTGSKLRNFSKDRVLNKQLNALYSSDEALGSFVKSIEAKYPRTLFVLLADHCGGVKGSSFENYLIPFALYGEGISAKYYDIYLSQRDIMPTLIDTVLGDYKELSSSASGKSLFRDRRFFADYYHNSILGWIEANRLIEYNTVSKALNCFDISTLKQKKVTCTKEDQAMKNRALNFSTISQDLLFKGKSLEFNQYRKRENP